MKRSFKQLIIGLGTGFVVLSLMSLAFIWRSGQWQLLSVQTGSMMPLIKPHDLVLLERVRPSDLRVGEVVGYRRLDQPAVVVTHRIVELDTRLNRLVTKGDALDSFDPPIEFQQVVGRERLSVPVLGWIFDQVHKPSGLIAGVYLPATAVVLLETRRLMHSYVRRHYAIYPYSS